MKEEILRKEAMCFIELMQLPASRTVLITIAKVHDRTLRVNIVPARPSRTRL